jgi:hypothetical protein
MTRANVSVPLLQPMRRERARMRRVALTCASPGIVHYAHPRPRGWLVPAVSGTAHRPGLEQESSHRHDFRPEHRQSQAAQGARKRERLLFHWQIVADGGLVGRRELRAFESKGRGGSAAEELGWREGIHRNHHQAVLLGGRDSKREGVLHW